MNGVYNRAAWIVFSSKDPFRMKKKGFFIFQNPLPNQQTICSYPAIEPPMVYGFTSGRVKKVTDRGNHIMMIELMIERYTAYIVCLFVCN